MITMMMMMMMIVDLQAVVERNEVLGLFYLHNTHHINSGIMQVQ
jgi:hypothetical protein